MTTFVRQSEPTVSDADLHCFVRDSLYGRGESRRLASVRRRLHDYRSSFALEEISARFDDGTELPLVFKDLSPESLLAGARELRSSQDYHPAREVIVYRDLLSATSLDAAVCYGALADAAGSRYWLLLESVIGHDLARTGDFAVWQAAARWLAEAHRRLPLALQQGGSELPLVRYPLMRYDRRLFQQWIERAEAALRTMRTADGRLVEPSAKALLGKQCRAAARLVDGLPATVIHGEFYASNIVVDAQDQRLRICPIDWETAGIGAGLIDVAALVAGIWTTEQQEEIAAAYWEAMGTELLASDRLTALRCCRLLLAVKWIGLSTQWQPPPAHRNDWLAEALQLVQTIHIPS